MLWGNPDFASERLRRWRQRSVVDLLGSSVTYHVFHGGMVETGTRSCRCSNTTTTGTPSRGIKFCGADTRLHSDKVRLRVVHVHIHRRAQHLQANIDVISPTGTWRDSDLHMHSQLARSLQRSLQLAPVPWPCCVLDSPTLSMNQLG